MSLEAKLQQDLKVAMKNQDSIALKAIRELKSLIMLEKTKEGGKQQLTSAVEIGLVSKAIKQHQETYSMFEQNGRSAQAAEEAAIIEVLKRYLPQQLSAESITEKLKQIIAQTGAQNLKDMGKVMAVANQELAGQDKQLIAETVKRLLS